LPGRLALYHPPRAKLVRRGETDCGPGDVRMKTYFNLMPILLLFLAMMLSACSKSDADIQKQVKGKLNENGIAGVTVSVKEGVVTLAGEVDDASARIRILGLAKSEEGVVSIVDNITVTQQVLTASDQDLKNKIEDSWRRAGC